MHRFLTLATSINLGRRRYEPLSGSTKSKETDARERKVAKRSDGILGDGLQKTTLPPSVRRYTGRGNEPENQSSAHSDISMSVVTSTKDLIEQGLMTAEDERLVSSSSKTHQKYLLSPEGYVALREAESRGRKVDFARFNALPAAVLAQNERCSSPLFRLAKNHESYELAPADYSSALENAVSCGLFDIAQKNDQGRNPIHTAASYGCAEAIRVFAAHDKAFGNGSALDAEALGRYTPLETVLACAPPQTRYDAAKALIDAGADLKLRGRAGPVQLAVESGDLELVKAVIDLASRKGIRYGKDSTGRTPMKTLKLSPSIPQATRDAIEKELHAYKASAAGALKNVSRSNKKKFGVLKDDE